MNDLRGVLIPPGAPADEVLRYLVYGVERRNAETRGVKRPSPQLFQVMRDLYAASRSPYGVVVPLHPGETVTWLSVAETAAEWACSPSYVRRRCRDGAVPGARKTSAGWLIPVPDSELAERAS